jgi:hypothetical protein
MLLEEEYDWLIYVDYLTLQILPQMESFTFLKAKTSKSSVFNICFRLKC